MSMINNEISEIIFLIMCIVCAYTIGKQLGIRNTIDYLESEGLLEFDDTEK
jgi:hypothetical protein